LGLVAGGWLLNLVAIVPNEGMPVSESALRSAGIASSVSITHGHLSKHVLLNSGTVLRALGDVIPLPWFRSVISVGDIVMAIGIGVVIATAMTMPEVEDLASGTGGTEIDRSAGCPSGSSLGQETSGLPELRRGDRISTVPARRTTG
jgi:hypothetical protein